MKLIRYEYPSLPTQSDYDRFFGTALPAFSRLSNVFDTLLGGAPWTGSPAADVFEDASNYHVKLELPGVKKDALTVEVETTC